MRILIVSSLVLAVGCGATARLAPAPFARADFGAADVDRDAELTQDEFRAAMAPYADEFDADGDGRLDADELAAGMFRAFDENGTGRIDEAELARGAMRWWPADVEPRFRTWNTHPDRGLDAEELREATSQVDLLRRWDRDRDGAVSHAEVSGAVFTTWDTDASESIDPFEWRWD